MKIYLDDVREAPEGYQLFTTAEQLILFLGTTPWNEIEEISLDHDLGEDRMTGYDVLRFIEEEVRTQDREVYFWVTIHSANPVGRSNMERAWKAICQAAWRS